MFGGARGVFSYFLQNWKNIFWLSNPQFWDFVKMKKKLSTNLQNFGKLYWSLYFYLMTCLPCAFPFQRCVFWLKSLYFQDFVKLEKMPPWKFCKKHFLILQLFCDFHGSFSKRALKGGLDRLFEKESGNPHNYYKYSGGGWVWVFFYQFAKTKGRGQSTGGKMMNNQQC